MKTYDLAVTKTICISVNAENYEAAQEEFWAANGEDEYSELWDNAISSVAYQDETEYGGEA